MPVDVPRVAVLLAAYNGMLWIEEQVSSILSQKDVDVTLYISVDRSTDGTYDWCAELSRQHQNVVVLPLVGRFGGAARNFFRLLKDVDFSDFEFVSFSDQDDVWNIDKLKRATHHLRWTGDDAYSSNVTAFWPDGKTRLLNKSQPQVKWDYLFEAAGPGCTYVLKNSLALDLKRSIIDAWMPLQRVTYHDWFCYAFARSHGHAWFIDPLPSMQYRQHERNQIGANSGVSSFMARYKTIRDGWWFDQIRLISSLIGKGDDPFVKGWIKLGRFQLLWLACNSGQCRRRARDRLFFLLVFCATAVLGSKAE